MHNSLAKELTERGFIHQFTSENLEELIEDEKRVIYHGIDPSGDSAHVGHMAIWILLRHLAQDGHKIIFLVGGGTGMIGDPKPDAERTLKTIDEIDNNVAKLKKQAEKLVSENEEILFVNNRDWLGKLGLIEFLRDIGKHFTVNELIKKDAIAKRLDLETGISYTEFAYPLLQGFDYLNLFKEHNCTLQIGGSDQWGNIVSGVELVRRKEAKTVHALTVPLVIDKATGKKFGKSEGNAVWLDPEKTTPFAFFQFWLQVTDINVEDYLKLFTFLPLSEIESIVKKHQEKPEKRIAQKVLATEVTSFVHGEETTETVQKITAFLFGEIAIQDLSQDDLLLISENLGVTEINNNESLIEVLVLSGLATSKREARTFITEGAVNLNEENITDLEFKVSGESGQILVLKRGKKKIALVTIK